MNMYLYKNWCKWNTTFCPLLLPTSEGEVFGCGSFDKHWFWAWLCWHWVRFRVIKKECFRVGVGGKRIKGKRIKEKSHLRRTELETPQWFEKIAFWTYQCKYKQGWLNWYSFTPYQSGYPEQMGSSRSINNFQHKEKWTLKLEIPQGQPMTVQQTDQVFLIERWVIDHS